MVTWLAIAKQYPDDRPFIIEHIKENIRHKKTIIRHENSELGVMVKIRDTFSDMNAIQDWSRYFINLHMAEIEDQTKEIEDDRREIDAIKGL